MSIVQPFLAQEILPTDVIPGAWRWMGLTLKELLIVLGAVSLVSLLVFLWAIYVRKRPRQHSHRHHHHHHSHTEPELSEGLESSAAESNDEPRYRRKRRRRREHRPRNPTLAETGGLPPVRAERPADPLP